MTSPAPTRRSPAAYSPSRSPPSSSCNVLFSLAPTGQAVYRPALMCEGGRATGGVSAGVAELVDALDLGSSEQSWGFESLRPHHFGTRPAVKRSVALSIGRQSPGKVGSDNAG